jgi:arginyl-tRNA synthetase
MKEVVIQLVRKALKKLKVKLSEEEISNIIELPPSQEMGDYSLPCFFLSETLKEAPNLIALKLRTEIKNYPQTDLEDVQTSGPYVNFFVNRKDLARKVVWEAITQGEKYGGSDLGKGKRTMVEFPSPNTNKPLHLGHLRNMSIGESVSRISEFNGEKVFRANLNNDRGIHICKSMVAYKMFGRNKVPGKNKKSDHFVGDFYVMFNEKSKRSKKLQAAAPEMLQKWEKGDKETLLLWKSMNNWALEGFKETYKKFGIKHNVEFFESKLYRGGKKMILEGVKNNIFEKASDGTVKINLEKESLGEKILLRKDGTSLYIVPDIYLAKVKFQKYKLDKSIYVVGNEQNYHFSVLFSILGRLGFDFNGLKHLSHGMINLPSGKMKSREGKVVDADTLMEDVQKLVIKELKKRSKLSKRELEKRSSAISLAAIKYWLLKIDAKKDTLFNPEESISFDGNTGPYILYSYARASSIIRKSKQPDKFKIKNLEKPELELSIKLSHFSDVVLSAYGQLNPALIANYVYETCHLFNEFYHACPVIGDDNEPFRLALVEAFRKVTKNATNLLGIEVLDEM